MFYKKASELFKALFDLNLNYYESRLFLELMANGNTPLSVAEYKRERGIQNRQIRTSELHKEGLLELEEIKVKGIERDRRGRGGYSVRLSEKTLNILYKYER